MRKLLIMLLFTATSSVLFSQAHIQLIQDTLVEGDNWRVWRTTLGENGAINIDVNQYMSKQQALDYVFKFADRQAAVIESDVPRRYFADLDTLLQEHSGKTYGEVFTSRAITSLQGDWVLEGDDSSRIRTVISNDTISAVKGPRSGTITIVNRRTISLVGFFANPLELKRTNEGRLVGLKGQVKIIMKRN